MVCAENLRVYVWMESLPYDAVAQRAVYHVLHRFLNHIMMCMSISCQQADALGDFDLLMAPNDGACIHKKSNISPFVMRIDHIESLMFCNFLR
jgi:hypothetical protein